MLLGDVPYFASDYIEALAGIGIGEKVQVKKPSRSKFPRAGRSRASAPSSIRVATFRVAATTIQAFLRSPALACGEDGKVSKVPLVTFGNIMAMLPPSEVVTASFDTAVSSGDDIQRPFEWSTAMTH